MPKLPPTMKWLPFCYLPVPFKSVPEGKRVFKPQYILVPKNYTAPKKMPKNIPVYITPKNF